MKVSPRLILSLLGFTACAVFANSNIYQPLRPPKAEDIVAFTNGLAPATGLRHMTARETILKFLRHGKNNFDVSSWYKLEYPGGGRDDACDGVMVDKKGQFYFWFLRTPKVLKLETSDGRTALLQLP